MDKKKKLNMRMLFSLALVSFIFVSVSFYYSGFLVEQAHLSSQLEQEAEQDTDNFGDTDDDDEATPITEIVLTPQSFRNGYTAFNYSTDLLSQYSSLQMNTSGTISAKVNTFVGAIETKQTLINKLIIKGDSIYSYMESTNISKSAGISEAVGLFSSDPNINKIVNNLSFYARNTIVGKDVYSQTLVATTTNAMGSEWQQSELQNGAVNLSDINSLIQVLNINPDNTDCNNFRNGSTEYTFTFYYKDKSGIVSMLNGLLSSTADGLKNISIDTLSLEVVMDKYGLLKSFKYRLIFSFNFKADISIDISAVTKFGNYNKNISINNELFYVPPTVVA